MAARGDASMKASASADDIDTPGRQPGKISANALAKFDLALSGSIEPIPRASLPRPRSEMASTSTSLEHIEPYRPHSVQICEPAEDMGLANKNDKKRKPKWKWNPLKKMRKLFSRKKSSQRTKSCEDLPTTANYRPRKSDENLTADEPQKSSGFMRTSTMPSNHKSPANVLKDFRKRQASSNEEVRDEMSPHFAAKALSLPTLDTTEQSRPEYEPTQEAGISFESDPNSSSLEGLQAAHDKIKAAPKKRRPPSRKRSESATSTDSPSRKEQRTVPHRRSKTDPKDLTKDRLDNTFESSSLSDILNNTIFEGTEDEDEQTTKSSPSVTKENTAEKDTVAIEADIMSRVSDAMARTSGPHKLATGEDVKKTEKYGLKPTLSLPKLENKETSKTTTDKFEVKKESKRFSLDEKTRKRFTEPPAVTSKSESDILKAEPCNFLYSEPAVELWAKSKTLNERSTNTTRQQANEDNDKQAVDIRARSTTLDGRSSSTPNQQRTEETEKEKPQETRPSYDKQAQNTTFKRGKSWSNNRKPKWIEVPVTQNIGAVNTEPTNDSKPSNSPQKGAQDTSTFTDKDFRFSRTKSWSFGDLAKANQDSESGGSEIARSSNEGEKGVGPTWIAKANRMSERISQLLGDPETPTLPKSTKESADKPRPSPAKPSLKDPVKAKPLSSNEVEPPQKPAKPSSPKPIPASKPNLATKPILPSKPSPPKPSTFVRNSGALPRIIGRGTSESKSSSSTSNTQKNSTKSPNSSTSERHKSVEEAERSSFANVKIEKCIVCGTTVYQMEKCKFDDSVLHRNCIKCSVCKRHLTVGNFVMTESKIYCKPHSRPVAVST